MVTSSPFIVKNKICKNKFHGLTFILQVNFIGIIMIKDSQPFIQGNLFKENQGIGLYIRDKSGKNKDCKI